RLVTYPFAIASAWLMVLGFWWLPRAFRILVPVSSFFFFEYGVISRAYSLGVFFLLLACWLYCRKSYRGALIALAPLFFVHLFFSWFALALCVIFVWELRESPWLARPRARVLLGCLLTVFLLGIWIQRPPT